MNKFAERIFLDRYALKSKHGATVGSHVIVRDGGNIIIGEVVGEDENTFTVQEDSGIEGTYPKAQIERLLETKPKDTYGRVADAAASVLDQTVADRQAYFWAMNSGKFVPGGRILAGAGVKEVSCYNCFVIPSPEDSKQGIFDTAKIMSDTMSRGGGVGINISSLRPKYAPTYSTNGRSSGAVSWGELYSYTTGLIEQGGSRRGALMLILNVWHPDVIEFANVKRDMSKIVNANISVGISDDFMRAVDNDEDWDLIFPPTDHHAYEKYWDGNIEAWKARGYTVRVHKTVKARELWNTIIESAWACADPGLWFYDTTQRMHNGAYFEDIICVNPCQSGNATVLTPDGIRTFDDIDVGSSIWSGEQWTTVVDKIATGIKPVYAYRTSYGEFIGTKEHRIVSNGDKIEVQDADSIDVSCGDVYRRDLHPQDIMDGLVIGDGTMKYDTVRLYIGEKDKDYFSSEIAHLIKHCADNYKGTPYYVNTTISYLPYTYDRYVPDSFYFGTLSKIAGFLRGLYSANGSVVSTRNSSRILLKQSSYILIRQVQKMLSALGIRAYITTNKPTSTEHHNGVYTSKQSYDLNITTDRFKFLECVGFIQKYKNQKIMGGIRDGSKSTEIQEVEFLGEMPVYDITVDAPEHTYWTGGLLVSNCGELPLPAWGVCNLGHINLSKFVDPATGLVEWGELFNTIHVAVKFLDSIIDATEYPAEEYELHQKASRRIGLGTLGLAEMLIKMGLRYGSDESLQFIDKLYLAIALEAYAASVDLATERGPFKNFDHEYHSEAPFVREIMNKSDALKEKFSIFGIRNVTLLTQAPTGTVGTMHGTSTGIEPFYYWQWTRKGRLGESIENVAVYEEWTKKNPDKALPRYFVTAQDITPHEHVAVQAAIQRWVDNSISKTCNLSEKATVKDVGNIYDLLYRSNCKGGTVYRDKSKETQVLNLPTEKEGKPIPKADEIWRHRPKVLEGRTYRQDTPVGTAYVTITERPDGPFETFVNIGNAGSELTAMGEALGRLISLILRMPSTLTPMERLGRVYGQLSGIGGTRSMGFGPNRVMSFVDGISKAIYSYLGIDAEESENKLPEGEEDMPKLVGDICPRCGDASFFRIEGCVKCASCGYSEC